MDRTQTTPANMTYLFDADAARTSQLTARRRARVLVADLDVEDATAAALMTDYFNARDRGDIEAMGTAFLALADLDAARPGEPSLIAELSAAGVGDLPAVA